MPLAPRPRDERYAEYLVDTAYLEQHAFEWAGERDGAALQYGTKVFHRQGFSLIEDLEVGERM
jgi:hypothetical protein